MGIAEMPAGPVGLLVKECHGMGLNVVDRCHLGAALPGQYVKDVNDRRKHLEEVAKAAITPKSRGCTAKGWVSPSHGKKSYLV